MFLEICEKLQFPQESLPVLGKGLDAIRADTALADAMEQAIERFVTVDSGDPTALLQQIADQTGIPFATATIITLVSAMPRLQQIYAARGVPEAIMWDTLIDLTCKLRENYDTNGSWGTEAISWYQRLYTLRILKLGRLEYEPIGYRWDTPYGSIQKDDPVINIHIPSCGSLPLDAVTDSLKQAYAFFRNRFDGHVPFVCASWMLYPPMCAQVFPDGSNLDSFYRCFEIVEQKPDEENKNFWRIFGMHYHPQILDKVPTDTSLRRKLLAFMQAGNSMGIGRGAFLFDGSTIVHRNK